MHHVVDNSEANKKDATEMNISHFIERCVWYIVKWQLGVSETDSVI